MKQLLIMFCTIFLFSACNKQQKKKTSGDNDKTEKERTLAQKHDLIEVINPQPNGLVSSPIKIEGKARGNWFFEATAGVEIVTEDNITLAEGYIEATEPWMTEDFVPFKGELAFDIQEDEEVFLIFHKANPSGLQEHEDEYRIPIRLQANKDF